MKQRRGAWGAGTTPKLTGIVLAGGLSTRMGQDKASLPWRGSDLLHTVLTKLAPVCAELIVVSNRPRPLSGLVSKVVPDVFVQCGPLAGLHAGLQASSHDYSFVIACDMPYLAADAVTYMAQAAVGYDAAVPFTGGYFHPLHAVYHKNCLPFIEHNLQAGNYKISAFFAEILLRRIMGSELLPFDPQLGMLCNLNTPADIMLLPGLGGIDLDFLSQK